MLVIGAENDALIAPKKIEKTARAYKADLKIFPGMAHDLMLERGLETGCRIYGRVAERKSGNGGRSPRVSKGADFSDIDGISR